MRNCSARLNACTVRVKHSMTELGTSAMMECSPWVPQRACMTSPCDGSVGRPVDGPPRITSTITQGTWAIEAKPMFSCISEKPGPEVAVSALVPASEAPMTAAIEAISSSIWMKSPPTWGMRRDSTSAISVDGVIGIAGEEAGAGVDGALGDRFVALHQAALRHQLRPFRTAGARRGA